jgi:acyl-coenzyme A synthetase/AMP-(fatty) acid ligase
LKPELFTVDSPGVNCVDRHKEKDPSRVAHIWEKDERGQEERFTTYGLDINITTNE